MILLKTSKDGDLHVRNSAPSPTVYLDHWGLRRFSEDEGLATRLTKALEDRGGTLALSWANLAEFSKGTSDEQTRKAECLIEANIPRLFFLEVDPFVVIDRENKLLAGGQPSPPHGDQAFLRTFVTLKPSSPKQLTAHGLFLPVRNQAQDHLNKLADTFVDRVHALRTDFENDSEFRSLVNRAKPYRIQRGTRFILSELVRALMIDKKTRMTRNDAMDFFHTVVPVAYCEVVLLDKRWETLVERVRLRLEQADETIPIATVFSGKEKTNGVDRFLNMLESG
jgi:hypothetical protein